MESKRSGNFKPLDNIVKNKYSELKKQGFNSKKINLRKAIIRYLQIENFKKIKKASSSNSYENMSWFKQIKRKYTIRYFKNARKYVELNTFRVRDQN
jgi:hypothetical protein